PVANRPTSLLRQAPISGIACVPCSSPSESSSVWEVTVVPTPTRSAGSSPGPTASSVDHPRPPGAPAARAPTIACPKRAAWRRLGGGDRRRPGDRGEVRPFDLDRDRPGGPPVRHQPPVRGPGRPAYRLVDLRRGGQVAGERALRADLLRLGPLPDRPVVIAPGDAGDGGTHRPAQRLRHVVVVHRGQVGDGRHPEL